jgi:predicted Fe-Mo cluster-binding NifX family protein
MLICLPTGGDAGLDDTVNEHFGSAPCFTLVDTDTGEVRILSNANERHEHGACHPLDQLTQYKIDCVVCGGMGRRAIQMLRSSGIAVYSSDRATVRDIVEQAKRGELVEMDPTAACAGHGVYHPAGTQHRRAAGGFGCGHGHRDRNR